MNGEPLETCSHCTCVFRESDTLKAEFTRNDGFRAEYPPKKDTLCYDCFIKINNPNIKCDFGHGWCK